MPQKGVTHAGELVDVGTPGMAHIVDTDEPEHEEFLKAIRDKHRRENPATVAVEAAAELKGVEPSAGDGGGAFSDEQNALVEEFGEKVGTALVEAGFASREAVTLADDATLLAIRGVGPGVLKKIRGEE